MLNNISASIWRIEGVEQYQSRPSFSRQINGTSSMHGYNIKLDIAGELCLITHFLKNNFVEVNQDEKNLSAKQYFTQAYTRISGKNGHKEWSSGDQAQKSKRAKEPVCKNRNKISNIIA